MVRSPHSIRMKILRFQSLDGSTAFAEMDADGVARHLEGDFFTGFARTGDVVEVVKILAPVEPVALLCVGLNYRQHAIETNAAIPEWPVLFMKAISSVQNPGDPIVLPRWMDSRKVDFECELAVVIGRECKNVRREDALDYVLGYTCANDVSARDWQKEGGGSQWSRGKSFDTFCPLGPCLVTADEIPNPGALTIRTIVSGELMQESSTADMIFDVPTLIEFLSGSTTLLPGTVILTGTPSGVGMARTPPRFLQDGDRVTVKISSIGSLENPVVEETLPAGGGSRFKLPG